MNRTTLAVLVALSFPAAAAASDRFDRGPAYPAAPPVAVRHQEDLGLRRLVASYAQATAAPGWRHRLPALEAELVRAFDREIAEARAGRYASRQGPWSRRDRLEQLVSLRAEFSALQGRFARRALERKQVLARQLVQVASLDARYAVLPLPPALAFRDRH
jgi:hypothetical protein